MKSPALLTGLLALVCSLSLSAAEPADSFAGLKSFVVAGSLPAVLHYDPALVQVINKLISTDEDPAFITRVFRAKLDRTQEEWYFVDFDSGPSDDPSFTITREGASEPTASIPGLHLYLPGNGALYASGHADTMFDEHRKYVLKGGKITETKQPFLAVGLEGKAMKDLTIYTTTAQKEAVAFIPKGATMTILVADGQDNYLVKTAFGLVGWVKIPPYSQDATVIEGLYYAGD